MVKLMKGYFDTGAESSEQEDLPDNRAGNGVGLYLYHIVHLYYQCNVFMYGDF